MTPERASALRSRIKHRQGLSLAQRAKTKAKVDEAIQERRRAAARLAKQERRQASWRHDSGITAGEMLSRPGMADITARLAEIPEEDERTLTARLMGDPIPGDTRDRRGTEP